MRHTWKAERVRIDGDMIDRSRCVRCAMVSTWPGARDECQGGNLNTCRFDRAQRAAATLRARREADRAARLARQREYWEPVILWSEEWRRDKEEGQ